MAKSDQVEKRIFLSDGEEVPGLIKIDEYIREYDAVTIPGRDRTVNVSNGVEKVPAIGATFKHNKGTRTLTYLTDWFENKETHDVTMIRTDGSGTEISRELWPNVEVSKCNAPAYDAAAPVACQVIVTFLPEQIIQIQVET